MKLARVQVTEFKSVRNSNEFKIGDVTCLVGKNEAGKTAVLQALYRLNPIIEEDGNYDVTNDYPRVDVEDYQHRVQTKSTQVANVVTAIYELDAHEVTAVEQDFGSGVFVNSEATLWKGYGNSATFKLNLDESIAVKHLLTRIECPDEVREEAIRVDTLQKLLACLTSASTKQDKALKAALAQAAALTDPAQQAQATDQANSKQESQTAKQLRSDLGTYLKGTFSKYVWDTYLAKGWPKFLYFDEYYQMEGQVNIQALKERQGNKTLTESDRPMLGLIDLARLDVDQLLAARDTQALLNKIEGASNHLSKQILKYWSQNRHILVRFDLRPALAQDPPGMREGTNLWGFVHDTKHLATTRLGTRSRGFIWFFSFLAWFSQQKKRNQPMILLLDEPGLFLHASAQADLLRYIEQELQPHHQVVYSTHSPFMVEPGEFARVRIVRDKSMESDDELPFEEQGTKVFTDVLEADDGSLFPLQGALGYDIAQTLFIGPNSLVVEGVSDLLYIQTMSAAIQADGKESLSGSWTVTPVGGSDKVPTFVALLGAQKKMKIATLIDFQKKDQQTVENLYKRKLLDKKNVKTFVDFTGTAEADMEDMFDPQFYLDIVNAEYKAELQKSIHLADLSQHPRMIIRLEKYFEGTPLKLGAFSHYRAARYLAENFANLKGKLDQATKDRFEQAFKSLNAIL